MAGTGFAERPAAFRLRFGASPSGKAVDFDSTIRRFESSRPSQFEFLSLNLREYFAQVTTFQKVVTCKVLCAFFFHLQKRDAGKLFHVL